MRQIFFTVLILFVFPSSLLAGELYSCIDRDGNTVMTTSPQDGMRNCVLKDSFEASTSKSSRGYVISGRKKYDDRSIQRQRQLEALEDEIQDKEAELLRKESKIHDQEDRIRRMDLQNTINQIYGR